MPIINRKAFSLLELTIAMAVMAILTSAITPSVIHAVQLKAAEKSALEIALIQDAARNFHATNHRWPIDGNELKSSGYLNPNWELNNPWGYDYRIRSIEQLLSVSTQLPREWVSLVKRYLPGFSEENGVVTSSISSLDSLNNIQPGIIVAWSGSIATIPKGWVLCDGTLNTPDLRDRFIIGSREDEDGVSKTGIMSTVSDKILKQIGGTITHDHEGKTGAHVLTYAEMPEHSHDTFDCSSPNAGCYVDFQGEGAWKGLTGGGTGRGLQRYQTGKAGQNKAHAHTMSVDYHVPPFYALAFIMKT